jgi:DNA modification methylase
VVKRWEILQGDVRETLRALETGSVQTCVTSPPYFGLRDYGVSGQIGLEPTPAEYVEQMVAVFREVRRVLRDDGTLWLNLGDSYASGGGTGGTGKETDYTGKRSLPNKRAEGLKPKDLIGIPWRVAFALQADGWYLRQDIIWHKPNPMPESVRDRCTKAHEYVFLLSKSERYFFDAEAMKEPSAQPERAGKLERSFSTGKPDAVLRQDVGRAVMRTETRNRRSVWTVATRPYKGAHFATFPPALIEPCILAGAPFNGLVLDPFTGSGTTAAVALQHGRRFIGCELNPDYIKLAEARIAAAEAEVLW